MPQPCTYLHNDYQQTFEPNIFLNTSAKCYTGGSNLNHYHICLALTIKHKVSN